MKVSVQKFDNTLKITKRDNKKKLLDKIIALWLVKVHGTTVGST